MTVRLSGLASGLDTESIIDALTSAYSTKKDKYVKAQTKLSWTQDAWKSLNSKVYSLYTSVGTLRYSSAYSMKKSTVSDSTKATVTASSGAINGTQKLKINQLASAGYLTGGQLASGTTEDSRLVDLNYSQGTTTKAKINVTVNGETKTIEADSTTTIETIIDSLNDAGVNASYDSTNRRIFISATSAGTESDFSITAGNTQGLEAISSLGLLTEDALNEYSDALSEYGVTDSDGNYDATATQSAVSVATQSLHDAYTAIASIKSDYSAAKTITNAISNLTEAYTDKATAESNINGYTFLNSYGMGSVDGSYGSLTEDNISSLASEILEKLKSGDIDSTDEDVAGYVTYAEDGSIDEDATSENLSAAITELNGYYLDKSTAEATITKNAAYEAYRYNESADWGNLSDDDISTMASAILASIDTDDLENSVYSSYIAYDDEGNYDATTTLSNITASITSINDAYYTVSTYDSDLATAEANLDSVLYTTDDDGNKTLTYAGKIAEYLGYTADQWVNATSEGTTSAIMSRLETANSINDSGIDISGDNRGVKLDGTVAKIELNGVEFESSTNNFSINGLTIECTGVTDDELTVTTATDTSGLYDKVKEFLSSYNSLINEMMTLYNADSASDYEPLTDDEKAEMTETEIEKWEQKIKDSLLRRDSTLSSLISTMTTAMMSTYEYNGTKYSFSTFGIATLGYLNAEDNENYAYHIDGDSEDSYTSGNEDKLLAALASDPDAVIDFMKNVTSGLYTALGDKMKSNAVSSIYTVYNDKEMASEYSNYTTLIKTWTTRVSDLEESYYSKFAAMESALATLQSNSSSISSLLG